MKYLAILLVSLIVGESMATDQWAIIDSFVGEQTLCDAFPAGSFRFAIKDCSLGCDEWQYTLKVSCDAAGANLEYWQGDHLFNETLIEPKVWAGIRGNLVRQKAKVVESYGNQFILVDTKIDGDFLTVTYEVNSSMGKIQNGTWVLKKGTAIEHLFKRTETTLQPFRQTRTETLQQ